MKLVYTLLYALFICLFATCSASAQGIVSFGSASTNNDHLQLDFTVGEVLSGSAGGETITLYKGSAMQPYLLPAFSPTGAETDEVPLVFRLGQNYPNPFNPTTTIEFDLPESADVQLDIYNVLGMHVATLVDTRMQSGSHTFQFNGSTLASGVYVYRLIAEGRVIDTKKMTLIK